MVCIYCAQKTQVVNTRAQKRANQIWRRRQCVSCLAVFTTTEAADLAKSMVVTGPSGSFTAFQRDKLMLSVYDALRHRKTAQTDATALTDTIISRLLPQSEQGSIKNTQIVTTARQILSAFDHAAATHYTAYHQT